MKKRLERLSVIMAMATVVAALVIGPARDARCEEVIWETDFAFIHFDWSGTWDKEDYYAYGFYLLDIPDWAYLFSVYGMGWDHTWGPVLWGTDGVWDNSDKVHINLYYGYDDGLLSYHIHEGNVYLNAYYFAELDLVNGGWVDQLCTTGRLVAKEIAHEVYYKITGPSSMYNEVEYSLAQYVAYVLWPWGQNQVSLESVAVLYRYYHGQGTYTTWHLAERNYWVWNGVPGHWDVTPEEYSQAVYTLLAWGFMLCDYDHYFGGNPNTSGATSIYRVADLLLAIRTAQNDETPLTDLVLAAYGHHAHADFEGDTWLWKDTADLNAYLYYLMWGRWYTG